MRYGWVENFGDYGVVQVSGESDEAFSAFCEFLEEGGSQGLERLRERYPFKVDGWHRDHDWEDRWIAFAVAVAPDAIEKLLSWRVGFIVECLSQAIEDYRFLRETIMSHLDKAKRPTADELMKLQRARIELDAWFSDILGTMHAVEEQMYGTAQAPSATATSAHAGTATATGNGTGNGNGYQEGGYRHG